MPKIAPIHVRNVKRRSNHLDFWFVTNLLMLVEKRAARVTFVRKPLIQRTTYLGTKGFILLKCPFHVHFAAKASTTITNS